MFKEILNIKKGDVISIVGSGGKTTTMFLMAEELKNSGSVLITTTTKISVPEILKEYELYFNSVESFLNSNKEMGNKVIILGSAVEKDKILGIDERDFLNLRNLFDYILIEADGAKKLPLKAWRDFEPVILRETTKTLGIIPGNLIKEKLDYNNIFNPHLFKKNFNAGEYFSLELLKNIITVKKGIFKNSRGDKYLYFNCCEGENKKKIKEVIEFLKESTEDVNYIYGSNKEGYCEN
ncbi:selenium cofactor biosynthesis protein YqeC [Anaerosphaera multitolerans]|uniref:Putative selenium-dependent hydroxylase accessory protein YqeC n=1 Tax=Anaerosphaera multitolerans TaxID=2487351 RepID=A0A437S539_9FIRM|nr:selenium cofactor biosynthesis protein YqeC [Anaerosphaera multitolerans]RVU54133.1 putative selenium-dependent hydroxylase accessory protein YqeC [Anaerosphaera multitolerans]